MLLLCYFLFFFLTDIGELKIMKRLLSSLTYCIPLSNLWRHRQLCDPASTGEMVDELADGGVEGKHVSTVDTGQSPLVDDWLTGRH